jgi:pimeloyl-ACP methyl ester carboxylesterase
MSLSSKLGEQKSVKLPQGTIRYRESGRGAPIVFVHGVLVNGDLWRDVVPRLADGHRCITPDWPLGAHTVPMEPTAEMSTPGIAKLVADFMAALDLRDVTLVGNDTGGAICQLVVTNHPERIGRLVLTSCDAFERYPPPPFDVLLKWLPRIPGGVYLTAQSMRFRFMRRQPTAFGLVIRGELDDELARSFTEPPRLSAGVRADVARLLNGVSNAHTLEAAERLPGFDRPVLLAWGGDDRLFPLDLAKRLAARFPRARLEVVPNARTFVPLDEPTRLAALILDFLGERAVRSA